MKPTHIGLTLYEYGKRIALEFESAQAEILALEKTLSGLVRISVPVALGHHYLTPVLMEFCRDHPNVNLRVAFNNRFSNLIEADIDIAIQAISKPPEDVVAREIGDILWHFYCTPGYRETLACCEQPEDLCAADFLSPQEGRKVDLELMSTDRVARISLAPRFASESVLFLRDCALNHMGVALLPTYMADDLVAAGTLIKILPEFSSKNRVGKLFILTVPNRFPTPAAQALIEKLRAALAYIIAGDKVSS